MRPALVALLVLLALLAGCADPGSPAPQDDASPEAFDDVEVTDTTGAIRGVVVNEAIVPVEGVVLALNTGQNKTSDAQGAFVFNGLEPGTYFITASKVGYFTVQQSVDVEAGVADPPVTKVQLAVDQASQPYAELLQWTGFLGCGFGTNGGGVRAVGVNPCAADAAACSFADVCLLNTANTHDFAFGVVGKVPTFAQAEMQWEGTQAFGDGLNLGWFDEGTADFKSTTGESPLILPTNQTEILTAHDEGNLTSLLVRVFPGTGSELTLTAQQRFDVYVTYFYGFEPRKDWAFVNEGACEPYTACQ